MLSLNINGLAVLSNVPELSECYLQDPRDVAPVFIRENSIFSNNFTQYFYLLLARSP